MSDGKKESKVLKKSDDVLGGFLLFLFDLDRTGRSPDLGSGGNSFPTAEWMTWESFSLPAAFSFNP